MLLWMRGLGKGSHAQPADLAGMHKSVPRAWNVSLPGALTTCAEHTALFVNLFSCSGFDVYFFVLLQACAYAPGQPHCCVCSWWGEKGVLCLYHRRGVCRPVSAVGQDALAMGHPRSLSRLILLCLFSECCSIQCLWESCFSQQPMQPCNLQPMQPTNHATCNPCNLKTMQPVQPCNLKTMQWVDILGLLPWR